MNPNINTKLSEKQKQKIIDWLNQKGASNPCPSCGHRQKTIHDELITYQSFSLNGNMMLGGPQTPVALVFCNNCLHVEHYFAVPMGIIEPSVINNKNNNMDEPDVNNNPPTAKEP